MITSRFPYTSAIVFGCLLFNCAAYATALTPKEKGINHVVVSKTEKAEEPEKDTGPSETEKKVKEILDDQDFQETTLTPSEELKSWPYFNDLLSHQTDEVSAALKSAEDDLAHVPPAALFYAAEAEAERGDMERAALYYYLAQLRGRFDALRWPQDPADQQASSRQLTALSLQIGQKISPWALSSVSRIKMVFAAVKKTDEKTPYSYMPSYRLPENGPEEKDWPALLKQARQTYFERGLDIIGALEKVK